MNDAPQPPRPLSYAEFRRMLIRAVDHANRADLPEPLLEVPPLQRVLDLGTPDVEATGSPGEARDEGER